MDPLTLTVDIVIEYHKRVIGASDAPEDLGTGGQLLFPGNLDFALEFYLEFADPLEQAAFLLHQIATGHPFVQGNKRMAFLLAALVLRRAPERYRIASSDEENNRVVRDVAEARMTRSAVESWLRSVVIKEG